MESIFDEKDNRVEKININWGGEIESHFFEKIDSIDSGLKKERIK